MTALCKISGLLAVLVFGGEAVARAHQDATPPANETDVSKDGGQPVLQGANLAPAEDAPKPVDRRQGSPRVTKPAPADAPRKAQPQQDVDDQCPEPEAFLKQLDSEGMQGSQELNIKCQVGKEKRLAVGLAALLRKSEADKSAALIKEIREFYRVASQSDSSAVGRFGELARDLSAELTGDTALVFTPGSGGQFQQMEPLLVKLSSQLPDDNPEALRRLREEIEGLSTEISNLKARVDKLPRSEKVSRISVALAIMMAATLISLGIVLFLLRKSTAPSPLPGLVNLGKPKSGQDPAPKIVSIPPAVPKTQPADQPRVGDSHANPPAEPAPDPWKSDLDELKGKFKTLEEGISDIAGFDNRLEAIELKVKERNPAPDPPDLATVYAQVGNIKKEIYRLQTSVAGKANTTDRSSGVPIDLEREVLGEAWKKLCDNKEVRAALNAARLKTWEGIRNPLLVELPQIVPEDIKPTFDMILGPARDFDNMVTKIALVRRLVKKEISPLTVEAHELMRLRELTSLLMMILNSNAVADRLNFQLEQWVGDHFISFADLFLQRYQQAQLDGQQNMQAQLDPGLQIVMRILRIADLEPVDLTPGQTSFDSNRHIGRSTASNSCFANGVIVGVVRNGFIRGGREVIRQPEVIVNRLA